MGWIDAELALTAVAAMLSPTTLSFSVLALVLGDRPLRTGVWFFLGALGVTLAVGVAAASHVLTAAPCPSLPASRHRENRTGRAGVLRCRSAALAQP